MMASSPSKEMLAAPCFSIFGARESNPITKPHQRRLVQQVQQEQQEKQSPESLASPLMPCHRQCRSHPEAKRVGSTLTATGCEGAPQIMLRAGGRGSRPSYGLPPFGLSHGRFCPHESRKPQKKRRSRPRLDPKDQAPSAVDRELLEEAILGHALKSTQNRTQLFLGGEAKIKTQIPAPPFESFAKARACLPAKNTTRT